MMGALFLNRELVRRGLAWHYKQYSDDRRLAADEQHARLKKLGLWRGSHKPIAPWDWRKLSKVERDEFRRRTSVQSSMSVITRHTCFLRIHRKYATMTHSRTKSRVINCTSERYIISPPATSN